MSAGKRKLEPMLQFWRRIRYGFIESVHDTLEIAKREGLLKFGAIILFILVMSGILAFIFEFHRNPDQFRSIWDALWWAVVTTATVGYGDKYPITMGGRLVTAVAVLSLMLFVMPL